MRELVIGLSVVALASSAWRLWRPARVARNPPRSPDIAGRVRSRLERELLQSSLASRAREILAASRVTHVVRVESGWRVTMQVNVPPGEGPDTRSFSIVAPFMVSPQGVVTPEFDL